MIVCQKVAAVALLAGGLFAERPPETARKAMEASISRQRQSVALMQLSISRQVAAARMTAPAALPGMATPNFVLTWPAMGPACDPLSEDAIAPMLAEAAEKEGIKVDLLRAVAEQESAFRPCAVSPKGAMGLMQLMPETAEDLGVSDPFDARQSLFSGAHLLKQLITRFGGDIALALGAYNAGPEKVAESGGIPANAETLHYVARILSRLPMP